MRRAKLTILAITVLLGTTQAPTTSNAQVRPTAPPAPAAAPVPLRPITVAPSLRATLGSKQRFDPAKLQSFVRVDADGAALKVKTREYRLLPAESTTTKLPRASAALPPPLVKKELEIKAWRPGSALPTIKPGVDHRSLQTPIRDQGPRGTCSAFATVAGLESFLRRKQTSSATAALDVPTAKGPSAALPAPSPTAKHTGSMATLGVFDLSENHAFNVALQSLGRTCSPSKGVPTWATTNAALDGLCSESAFPYSSMCPSPGVPAACGQGSKKKLDAVYAMYTPSHGVPDVQEDMAHRADNLALLEAFLDFGADIIYAVDLAGSGWKDDADTGVIDVQVNSQGYPVGPFGAHAMLMVGYNRPQKYFIFKNSWGTDSGHDGYIYLSYDYVQTYAWYGFAVLG